MSNWLRRLIDWNRCCSRWQSDLANRWTGRIRGREDFCERLLPGLLRPGLRVLDVGGGKQPAIPVALKRHFQLQVVGLDISAEELRRAPSGAYDSIVVGDITRAPLAGCFDLAVSRAVLEHVPDNQAAIANMASALAPGGRMAHFVPCGKAMFARLNQLLGNRFARRVLFALYPDKRETQGFPAYYDHCSPSQMTRLCQDQGLRMEAMIAYFQSEYFAFCAPLQAIELMRQVALMKLGATQWCETFAVVASKPAAAAVAAACRAA